jgi:hypothetical protein
MRTFRHWAWAFEVVDHEAASTTAAVLAGGAAILTALAVAAGGALRADGEGLTVAAWLAMVCLGAGLLLAASEVAAWAIARPIGRDVARAVAALEAARIMVARLEALRVPVEPDTSELVPMARRIDQATTRIRQRLTEADASVCASAALRDARTRTGRLAAMGAEARTIAASADALDSAAHLLRWIEACPWSAARPAAVLRLRAELVSAERLVSGPVAQL